MKRLAIILLALLIFAPLAKSQALQVTTPRFGPALPPCPGVSNRNLWGLFLLTTGNQAGIWTCLQSGWSPPGAGLIQTGTAGQYPYYASNGIVLSPDPNLDTGVTNPNGWTSSHPAGLFAKKATLNDGTGTAGAWGFGQGTNPTVGQCSGVNCIGWSAPTSISQNGWFLLPQSPTPGLMAFGAQTAGNGIVPGSTSGDASHADKQINQTGSIQQKNLCPATAVGCSFLGTYTVFWNIRSTGSCATPGSAGVTLTLGWTDDTGAKTFVVPQSGTGSSGTSVALGATGNFGQGSFTLSSTGAVAITYLTTATACTSGSIGYNIDIASVQVR